MAQRARTLPKISHVATAPRFNCRYKDGSDMVDDDREMPLSFVHVKHPLYLLAGFSDSREEARKERGKTVPLN